MVRALYDASFYHIIPDFKESSYDLGSFDDIAHKRGSKGGKANEFSAGFDAIIDDKDEEEEVTSNLYKFDVTFAKQGATPVPKIQNHNYKNVSVEERFSAGRVEKIIGRTSNGAWEMQVPYRIVRSVGTRQQFPPLLLYLETPSLEGKPEYSDYKPLPGNPEHIIALAKISGARLLYSNDQLLQRDFNEKELIDKPRGKIYSTHKTDEYDNSKFDEAKRRLLNRNLCQQI